jgi:chaperonin GroEL (HSP60 family)
MYRLTPLALGFGSPRWLHCPSQGQHRPQRLKGANFNQQLGITIIRNALTRPARTIVENAGEEGSVVVGTLLEKHAGEFNMGYDAAKVNYPKKNRVLDR